MKELVGSLVSVHAGNNEDLSKEEQSTIEAKLDGFAGDKHSGFERVAWRGDKDPEGTVRRNERQWSGVSVEELAIISKKMDLKELRIEYERLFGKSTKSRNRKQLFAQIAKKVQEEKRSNESVGSGKSALKAFAGTGCKS